MSSALHIYIDPLATPAQLRLIIKEYKKSVAWIGILGRSPWLASFDKPAEGIEVVKGDWYSADDRNRLTSLTPGESDFIAWLYGSDVVRFPLHLLVRGKGRLDYISTQVILEPDLYGRTTRYRYYPRLVARDLFIWKGSFAPFLKISEEFKVAINRKAVIESRVFSLPSVINDFHDLQYVEYEELVELFVFKKLNLLNSIPRLIELASKEDFPVVRRSILLALAAKILLDDNRIAEAKGAMTLAVSLGSLTVFHYLILAELAYLEGEYASVIQLVDKGLSEPWLSSEFPLEPILIRTQLCKNYALSAIKLGLPEEAKASLLEVEQFQEVATALSAESKQQLQDLSGYIPKIRTSKKWPEKSIVYFCGQGLEPWDDSSLKSGIGGSESAVIYLSREWVKAGYKVTVFGSPHTEHVDEYGVEWLDHSKCHSKDQFDIFIAWRNFGLFDQPVSARISLLDCHDILLDTDADALKLSRIHRLMVKSVYHRNNLYDLDDGQFEIISNGIDLGLLEESNSQSRKLKKVIYASSYDRGLEMMLRYGWARILNRHPDAELHLYYGWEGYDKMPDPTGKRAQWKRQMLELFRQPGIFEHGRVGHQQLLTEKQSASVHYYGCTFEEIDCISVRESAAAGCLPVSTAYAALNEKEYVKKVPGDPRAIETHKQLADLVSNLLGKDLQSERERVMQLARSESWKEIARRWMDLFEAL